VSCGRVARSFSPVRHRWVRRPVRLPLCPETGQGFNYGAHHGEWGQGPGGCSGEGGHHVFEPVPFLFKTRKEVLKLLGDPAIISDYGQRTWTDSDGPLVYRFEAGYGRWQYTIGFLGGKVDRVQAEPFS
jgi:hypothetical protein